METSGEKITDCVAAPPFRLRPDKFYLDLSCAILKAVRGQRSQNQINRRLGYTFNQVSKWESSHTRIHWCDFVDVCEVTGLKIRNLFRATFGYRGKIENTSDVLHHLMRKRSRDAIGKACQIKTNLLGRWLRGDQDAELFQVLKLIDRINGLLPTVLEQIAPSLKCNEVKAPSLENEMRNIWSDPFLLPAFSCLGLASYQTAKKHPTGLIAAQLEISLAAENTLLEILETNGIIQWNGAKYVPHRSGAFADAADHEGLRRTLRFWMNRHADGLREGDSPEGPKGGFFVAAIPKSLLGQIKKITAEYRQDIYEILNQETREPCEVLFSLAFGLQARGEKPATTPK